MNATRKCSVDECERKHLARSFCSLHYRHAKRDGTLANAPRRHFIGDVEGAFKARTEWQGDCLIWTGAKSSYGYGQLRTQDTLLVVHRYAWERVNGPIPEGMLIDHRFHCDPACCNPDHLRLATRSQNNSHQDGPRSDNQSTGVRNVYPTKNGKYRVMIGHQGEQHWLGVYSTLDAAQEVAEATRKELFGEYAGNG